MFRIRSASGPEGSLSVVWRPAAPCSVEWACCQRCFCKDARLPRTILDDILLAYRALQTDGALGLHLPYNRDDLLLRRLDLFDFDRAQRLHVFSQHLGTTRRHTLQEVFLELVTGSFQGNRQHLAVDAAKDLLHAVLIDQQQVFEDEHQVADGLRERRVPAVDGLDDLLSPRRWEVA